MALSLAMALVALVSLLTSSENGSPDNASGCGNSTGYDDGRSGTHVATATSLAMATALAVAMGAPAGNTFGSITLQVWTWDQQSGP